MGVVGFMLGLITVGLFLLVDHHHHAVSFVLTDTGAPKSPYGILTILRDPESYSDSRYSERERDSDNTDSQYASFGSQAVENTHHVSGENLAADEVRMENVVKVKPVAKFRIENAVDVTLENFPVDVQQTFSENVVIRESKNRPSGRSLETENDIDTLNAGPLFREVDVVPSHLKHVEKDAVTLHSESSVEKDLLEQEPELEPESSDKENLATASQTRERVELSQDESKEHEQERVCILSRNGLFTQTPCKMAARLPRFLPEDVTVVEVDQLPLVQRYMPEIGNSHLATVLLSNTIFMNGLYNGGNVTSHRARIPSTTSVVAKIVSPASGWTQKYRMDFGRGVFTELYTADDFTVTVNRYAHRQLTRVLVTEVIVNRTATSRPVTIEFNINNGTESEDIDVLSQSFGMKVCRTKEAEYPDVAPTTDFTMVYSEILPNMTFDSIIQAYIPFITSISTDHSDAIENFNKAGERAVNGTLLSLHEAAWDAVWQEGRIDLQGNNTMALSTYATLYYLLSSLPVVPDSQWPFVGMAPGGLAHGAAGQDYEGHVFWDQDTWMFPSISLLHSDIGRIIVGTRLRTHQAALMYAHMTGYKGARYPWESAFTGLNVSPSKSTTVYENHITGDTAWMMRQYIQQTNDTNFLTADGGYKALADIAEYWLSRVTYNKTTKLYEIRDAMGPDEWHAPVNNSVYTNVIAVQSLETANYAAFLTNQTPPKDWEEVAANMYIPFDKENQYHPEFDGYVNGTNVKQADVILLAFPLKWPMASQVQQNDLIYYAAVTPGGPAMTWGMFAIGWLRLGPQYKVKADTAFYKGTYNIQNPFKVWSENADGTGAVNFHTGMGGYLQSLLFGYAGFDFNDDHLGLNPALPPSLTAVTVTGVDYLESSFDLSYDKSNMNVTLTKGGGVPLEMYLVEDQMVRRLNVGETVTAKCQEARLWPSA